MPKPSPNYEATAITGMQNEHLDVQDGADLLDSTARGLDH
jgi:hypothetical protein